MLSASTTLTAGKTEPHPAPGKLDGPTPGRFPASLIVVLAVSAMFGGQMWLGIWQVHHFGAAGYDLGLFAQEVSAWGHFHLPSSTIDLFAHHDALGEHFSPIIALLGPVWRLFPSPLTLLAAQSALLAASAPPVVLVANRRLGWVAAAGFAVAYACSWELIAMGEYQFHELAFAVPILAWALERADAGRWTQAALVAASLVLVKEDMALVAAVFAFLVWRGGQRRVAATLAAGALTWFAVVVVVVMPHLGQNPSNGFASIGYGDLAPSAGALPLALVEHPMRLVRALGAGLRIKLDTLWASVVSTLGLSLFSPITLLALPILVSRFLTDSPSRWGTHYHYNAVLAPILVMATIDTVTRGSGTRWSGTRWSGTRWSGTRWSRGWRRPELSRNRAIGLIAGAVALVPFTMGSFSPLSVARQYRDLSATPAEQACHEVTATADRVIPPRAYVEAITWLMPDLVGHLDRLYLPYQAPVQPAYLVVMTGAGDPSLPASDVSAWISNRAPLGYQTLARGGSCELVHVTGR